MNIFTKTLLASGATASLLALCVQSAQAAVMFQPTGASTNSLPFIGNVNNLRDQSGLSPAYTSGVTDFDTYTATHTTGGDNGYLGFRLADDPTLVTFDLGAITSISGLKFWNQGGELGVISNTAVTGFTLYTDDDGDFFNGGTTTIGNFLPTAPIVVNPSEETFTFSTVGTRWIHLEVTNTADPEGDELGFSFGEIAFAAEEAQTTPEPGTILGLVTVGALGALSRQRKG
jgi:hypothetical protein